MLGPRAQLAVVPVAGEVVALAELAAAANQRLVLVISTNHSSALSQCPPITAHLTTSSGLSLGRHSHLPQMQSPRLLQRICVVLSDRHPASHSPWGITYHCQAGIFIDERRIK